MGVKPSATWSLETASRLSRVDLRAVSALLEGAGMQRRAPRALASAIARSVTVVARDPNGDVIGFGRLIGDGVYYGTLWDVVVAPVWRRKRVGRAIVERLLSIAKRQNLRMTGLFTAPHNHRFYRHEGFVLSSDIRAMIRKGKGQS